MVISIQVQGGGTVLFQTVEPTDSSDKVTGSFFDHSSFVETKTPRWNTNYSANRDGGYKHYAGLADARYNVLLYLTGTSRFNDLQTWKNIAGGTVFYMAHDTDSNLDKDYVITRMGPVTRTVFPPVVTLQMTWEEYNN